MDSIGPASGPARHPAGARDILVSVVLCPGGTDSQREQSRKSVEENAPGDCEFLAPVRGGREGTSCRGRYVLFLMPGDILLPRFRSEIAPLLGDGPDIVLLASYSDANCTHRQLPLGSALCGSSLTGESFLRDGDFSPACKLIRRELLRRSGTPSARAIQAVLRSSGLRAHVLPLLVHPRPQGKVGFLHTQGLFGHTVKTLRQLPDEGRRRSLGFALAKRLFDEALGQAAKAGLPGKGMLAVKMVSAALRLLPTCGFHSLGGAWKRAREQQQQAKAAIAQRRLNDRKAGELRRKEVVNVLFIVTNTSYWKADSLLQAMLRHPRFRARVLIAPETDLPIPARRAQMEQVRRFMESRGYPLIELCDEWGRCQVEKIPEEYDILLYPKPYSGCIPGPLDYPRHRDRLWISIPYSFHSSDIPAFYDLDHCRSAWLDCFENPYCAETAARLREGGSNAIATGLPFVDSFLHPGTLPPSPWKAQPEGVKRIIWAPHWTISPELSPLYLSHFLQLAEGMDRLAQETQGSLQWAFKPHPLLYKALLQHPDWGQERADAYYSRWAEGSNTQLETGDYVPLFLHSDALVHDSDSFCTDYHLTGKPALFLARDLELQLSDANAMGREAIEAQYIGKGMEDVHRFIASTVLGGQDPMRPRREAFREHYLIPPQGRTAAENIIEYILTGKH